MVSCFMPQYLIGMQDNRTPQLVHKKENENGDRFEMKIKFEGKSLFLVPVQAIVEAPSGNPDVRIVAALRANLKDKNTYLWKDETVDSEVDPFPVASLSTVNCQQDY